MSLIKIFLLLGYCACVGCVKTSITPPEERIAHARQLIKIAGWHEYSANTKLFTLKFYGPIATTKKRKTLTVYIEGDGLAWLAEDMPSNNPTPIDPMGLKMAIHAKKGELVVYLARPCQFVFNNKKLSKLTENSSNEWKECKQAYWTNLRFSEDTINAMNQALSQIKKYYNAKQLILVGYSGGGTIATLLAARRNDIRKLITVAAVLDTDYWVHQEGLTPLYGSKNPANEWQNLLTTPQTHWVGGKDTVVPKENAFAFSKRFPIDKQPNIKIIPNFNHFCCWDDFYLN